MASYIKLLRSNVDWRLLHNAEACRLYLYFLVNADENGQIQSSSGDAMRLFGLSRQKYRDVVNLLSTTNKITIKATNKTTIITICELSCYNHMLPTKQPQNKPTTQPATTNKPSSNTLTLNEYVDPRFADAWQRWLDYRKEINNRYKSAKSERIGYQQFIKKSNNDPVMAMEMVNNTIANGYKGLFPDKNNGTSKSTCTPDGRKIDQYSELEDAANAILRRPADFFSTPND